MAMLFAVVVALPPAPRYVEYTSEAAPDCEGSIFAMNASGWFPVHPLQTASNGETIGKSTALVSPVRYAYPALSTATAHALSTGMPLKLFFCPPRYVE